ncbi:2,5-diketo-D-gluconic acid reductase-like protein [Plenodomus tracheiphilus IPT5]|uniref:2,5-diketo-D-gluconic acid reductase-like protein n=1 Tax=Plenodomus tracheiphilus IPT5 TaxID=1408161 RepID=A0A6A7BK85_9PLEO|nr:2,5-diketo-D-gluconic acid reductase-like protein [Plenodomus tracheiphilus IPT5]
MPTKPLNISTSLSLATSKYKIPQIGFGVYQSPPEVCVASCKTALESGYRHIDTAQYYENETEVGRALKESKVPREEVYITTKILFAGDNAESTYNKLVESVEKLAGKDGYVDLFLIHSPNFGPEKRKLMWNALEKLKQEGKTRDIGVSNYGVGHIKEIASIATSDKVPAVNQIELHPWCQQRAAVQYCQANNITIEAYCPLVRNQKATDKILVSIADKHNIEPNQVLIRWSLQKGYVPLPKSDTPSRIAKNADVYGFELDESDMQKLNDLDQGEKGAIVQAVSNE